MLLPPALELCFKAALSGLLCASEAGLLDLDVWELGCALPACGLPAVAEAGLAGSVAVTCVGPPASALALPDTLAGASAGLCRGARALPSCVSFARPSDAGRLAELLLAAGGAAMAAVTCCSLLLGSVPVLCRTAAASLLLVCWLGSLLTGCSLTFGVGLGFAAVCAGAVLLRSASTWGIAVAAGLISPSGLRSSLDFLPPAAEDDKPFCVVAGGV